MSGREGTGEFRKRKHDNFPHGHRREEKDSINPPSAMTMSFKAFQVELDTKHDKYERLVKLSRDITIESKRVIFLLHRITSAPNGEEILMESETKLDLVRQKIKQVAQELMGEDMYQFHRAISPGLQEYVEAVSFQYFIKTRSLVSIEEINRQLIFSEEDKDEEAKPSSQKNSSQSSRGQDTKALATNPHLMTHLSGTQDITQEITQDIPQVIKEQKKKRHTNLGTSSLPRTLEAIHHTPSTVFIGTQTLRSCSVPVTRSRKHQPEDDE
uniref:Translin associated factor X n=1 Tax=Podarcis muralis TaxID=64176 RepID=A0A670HLY4_PODMU